MTTFIQQGGAPTATFIDIYNVESIHVTVPEQMQLGAPPSWWVTKITVRAGGMQTDIHLVSDTKPDYQELHDQSVVATQST